MKKINLKEIIEFHNLDESDVAEKLFPGNKYATLALRRLFKGEALLDERQIITLSELTGEDISDLFTEQSWKMRSCNCTMALQTAAYAWAQPPLS